MTTSSLLEGHLITLGDIFRRSQWPRGLRRGSAAARRLLRLWFRIPPRHGYVNWQ